MELEEAIKVTEELVFAKQGRWLEEPEKIVLKAAWLNLEYKDIAQRSPYKFELLQRRVAPALWMLLTGILGDGEKVTKRRFRHILEQRTKSAASFSTTKLVYETSANLPILGGHPPDVSKFYGRTPELAMLKEFVVQERCVVVTGAAGIGKSALAAKMLEILRVSSYSFSSFIWKSVSYSPSLASLVAELLKLIANLENKEIELPKDTEDGISILIEQLQSKPYLLVIDSAEALLQGDRNNGSNPYGKEYAGYGIFFRRIIEAQHKSCLLLISREPFVDISRLQNKAQPCVTMKIEGLRKEAFKILQDKGLNTEEEWRDLIHLYRGNPLVLQIVAHKIKVFFGGSVKEFLKRNTTLMDDAFEESLDDFFKVPGRLTTLEKEIMIYLAEELTSPPAEAIPVSRLLDGLNSKKQLFLTTSKLLEALAALIERSLIEEKFDSEKELLLDLQPLIKKYIFIYYIQSTKLVSNIKTA